MFQTNNTLVILQKGQQVTKKLPPPKVQKSCSQNAKPIQEEAHRDTPSSPLGMPYTLTTAANHPTTNDHRPCPSRTTLHENDRPKQLNLPNTGDLRMDIEPKISECGINVDPPQQPIVITSHQLCFETLLYPF